MIGRRRYLTREAVLPLFSCLIGGEASFPVELLTSLVSSPPFYQITRSSSSSLMWRRKRRLFGARC